jgi:methylphosphotriester-DNA--protein-cysteine methyltransferase
MCTQDEYAELEQQRRERLKLNDKKAKAIMRNIAEGFDSRGHFLEKFARMFAAASEVNQECLLPAAHKLIEKYDIEKSQLEKGVLNELQYK